jgi:hypothetical protein
MNKANIIARLNEIQNFADNLLNASCDGTRRDAVEILARRIGGNDAKLIAESFGLVSEFYFANLKKMPLWMR